MTTTAFAIFETAIGWCGIAWNARGITGAHLPEASEAATRERVQRRFPEARETVPPPDIQSAIAAITALMDGEPRDLSALVLDMDGIPEFNARVYAVARTIPPGETLTYGEIATRLGEPNAARAVGKALGENRFPIIVPCHRVLGADGKFGGFSARGGLATKARLLTIEGARTSDAPMLFDRLPVAGPARRR